MEELTHAQQVMGNTDGYRSGVDRKGGADLGPSGITKSTGGWRLREFAASYRSPRFLFGFETCQANGARYSDSKSFLAKLRDGRDLQARL